MPAYTLAIMGLTTSPWLRVLTFGFIFLVLAEVATVVWNRFRPNQALDDYTVVWFILGIVVVLTLVTFTSKHR